MRKTFVLCIIALAYMVSLASGAEFVFTNYSAASGSAVYSPAFRVDEYRLKTIQVNGATMSTHAEAALSGTFLLQCGMSKTGPWITCKDRLGNAVSTTANAAFTLEDATLYVRGSWQKTAGEVNAVLGVLK